METYEKKYKEALEWARKVMQGKVGFVLDEVLEKFPELKESEGEKTKRLLHTIANKMGQHLRDIFTEEEYQCFDAWSNAWLEKQGEHKKFRDSIQVGDKVTRNEDGVLVNLSQLNRVAKKDEKQGEQKSLDDVANEVTKDKDAAISFLKSAGIINENGELADEYKIEQSGQKPVWSEEDEEHLNDIIELLPGLNIRHNWLKSLKDRLQSQTNAEWSDEDENYRTSLLGFLNGYPITENAKQKMSNWLKSLRPQSQWKPSDEQIYELTKSIDYYTSHGFPNKILNELLKQLKNL